MTLLDGTYYILSRRMFDMTNFRDWTDKFYAFSKTGEKLSEIDISQVFTSYHYLHCQNDTLVARIGSRKGARTLYFDKRGQSWNLSGKQRLCSRKILRIQFSGTRARTFDPVQNRRSSKHEHLHGRQTESRQTHRPERVQIDRGMKKWLDIIGRPRTMELLSSFVRNNRLLHLFGRQRRVYMPIGGR
ncbi:hypothetical protein [Alistipes sp. AF48-12]|uniref:hypothetical protein n=1 Tax=Alistipes sp. AF48-12 TaxID=2291998 RepID=UPI0011C4A447|nr:hypothetical protein [Alistipes sp. AF48-12]